jgi:hypothetical protein
MEYGYSILSYLLSELYIYVATAGVLYIAFRFVLAYERRGIQVEQHFALTERVQALEDVVDRVEDRVDRSDEVQRFTTSVLAARLTNGNR